MDMTPAPAAATANAATANSEWRAMLALSLPLAAANLLQMLVYAVDVIFVARLGEQALAVVSLSTTLFMLSCWCMIGLTSACAPLISAELGRRRHAVREVRRTMRMTLWLCCVVGLLVMAVGANGERILLLMGQDPVIARESGRFLSIMLWATIPTLIANALRNFVSALGRPVFATIVTAVAILVNAIGNYAFVYGHFGAPRLGGDGSAISSVITGVAMMLAYILVIRTDRRLRRYRLFGRLWRAEWQRMRDIVRIGTPIALIILAEGGLFSSAAFLMGLIGEAELAGHAVALQVAALAFQVPFGIGQAVTIRVGYHYGAGNRTAIGQAGKAALFLAIGYMIVPALLMIVMPRAILGIYVDVHAPQNAALIAFAVQYLAVAAAFQLFDGVQAVMSGALRGLQDTRVPMMLAVAGYWLIGFVTSAWLGLYTPMGGLGVWIGLAGGLIVVAALMLFRWTNRARIGLLP